jgi:hypothetical protein
MSPLVYVCMLCILRASLSAAQKSLLLNPYTLVRDLLGADFARKLCLCLIALVTVVVIVIFSPVIGEGVSLFSAAEALPRPFNFVGMGVIGAVLLCLCCCCCILVRRCTRYLKTKCSCLTSLCSRCCCTCRRPKKRRKRVVSVRKSVEMKRR